MKSNKGNKLGTLFKSSSSSRFQRQHKPAELYRTDFITAMKLPDTESLDEKNYWIIRDPWRLDWEKGVQVPVKPESLNIPNCSYFADQFEQTLEDTSNHVAKPCIKLPKKYLCPANDKSYKSQVHEAYITHGLYTSDSIKDRMTSSLSICKYDCDQMDVNWLNRVNLEMELAGQATISRITFERLVENFELQSHHGLKTAIEKLQSYSIEYDEDIVCDVCHSPDSEDNNEMVFCDGCNMCVHQACYGIEKIPKGNWLCAPCTYGGAQFRPECVLCPHTNGAMKASKNCRHWAHVSCALWIPETGFGNPDKMEPIVNLGQIAAYRWQLVCSLCKEKRGCCIQCSEKKCHLAFHVTCAFKHNLSMQTIAGKEHEDDVEFRSFCSKHTKWRQENKTRRQEFEEESESCESQSSLEMVSTVSNESLDIGQEKFLQKLSRMSEHERKIEIVKQIQSLNFEFYKNVDLDLSKKLLSVGNQLHLQLVFNYWKLKRRFNASTISEPNNQLIPVQNKPLMMHRHEQDLINRNERKLISQVKMFINLRQDLERVRNLSYMVVKREKCKKQYFQLNQTLFHRQVEYLSKYSTQVSDGRAGRLKDILQLKNDRSVYDFPEYWLNDAKKKPHSAKSLSQKLTTNIKKKYSKIEKKKVSKKSQHLDGKKRSSPRRSSRRLKFQ
ncbi:Jade-3 isoform X3 [Brachionus plicatilis]|uniref:Jade-3 isoform X3 n=1 Tax=Brachionus plicatilis TaxID=10195 RepID=A0A3M7PPY6_BRAPC|nr:Jade-3 isoform X3 [Brachionus plicatilis]